MTLTISESGFTGSHKIQIEANIRVQVSIAAMVVMMDVVFVNDITKTNINISSMTRQDMIRLKMPLITPSKLKIMRGKHKQ